MTDHTNAFRIGSDAILHRIGRPHARPMVATALRMLRTGDRLKADALRCFLRDVLHKDRAYGITTYLTKRTR